MKLQTIINHEIEIGQVEVTASPRSVNLTCTFNIKHTKGIKNNTITLKNLVRTSDDFKQLIVDTFIKNACTDLLQPIDEEEMALRQGNDYCRFDIWPRSGNKGMFYITVDRTTNDLDEISGKLLAELRSY